MAKKYRAIVSIRVRGFISAQHNSQAEKPVFPHCAYHKFKWFVLCAAATAAAIGIGQSHRSFNKSWTHSTKLHVSSRSLTFHISIKFVYAMYMNNTFWWNIKKRAFYAMPMIYYSAKSVSFQTLQTTNKSKYGTRKYFRDETVGGPFYKWIQKEPAVIMLVMALWKIFKIASPLLFPVSFLFLCVCVFSIFFFGNGLLFRP